MIRVVFDAPSSLFVVWILTNAIMSIIDYTFNATFEWFRLSNWVVSQPCRSEPHFRTPVTSDGI
jgi:hypothetical protein